MTVLRAQCAFRLDSGAPTDVAIINPHFKGIGIGNQAGDAQQLASDLATALGAWTIMNTEVHVTMYDAEGPPPHYPLGEAFVRKDQAGASGTPRELAVCLSYWAGTNRPRRRGRLYVPYCVATTGVPLSFIAAAAMTKVAALVPIMTALGGANVDWCVWSRIDKQAHSITNWQINNAWDIQRSRGNLPTAQQTGTTSEAGFPRLRSLQPGVEVDDQGEDLEAAWASAWADAQGSEAFA